MIYRHLGIMLSFQPIPIRIILCCAIRNFFTCSLHIYIFLNGFDIGYRYLSFPPHGKITGFPKVLFSPSSLAILANHPFGQVVCQEMRQRVWLSNLNVGLADAYLCVLICFPEDLLSSEKLYHFKGLFLGGWICSFIEKFCVSGVKKKSNIWSSC